MTCEEHFESSEMKLYANSGAKFSLKFLGCAEAKYQFADGTTFVVQIWDAANAAADLEITTTPSVNGSVIEIVSLGDGSTTDAEILVKIHEDDMPAAGSYIMSIKQSDDDVGEIEITRKEIEILSAAS